MFHHPRGTETPTKKPRAEKQTAQCATSLPNPSANKSRCEFTRRRTRFRLGGASSGLPAQVPPQKVLCHVRHRSGYNQVFGDFQKLLQRTCFIDPRCPVRLAAAETWKLVLSKGTLGRLTSYHVAEDRCVPSSGILVEDR